MAESLVFDMSGDSKSAEAAFNRLIKENDKLRKSVADVNKEVTKGAKANDSWMKGQVSDLKNMAAQWVSIGAVVGIATSAYQRLRAETEKLGQAHQKLSSDITKAISRAGDLSSGAKIESHLGSVKGATKEQATLAFSGISDAAPGMALQRRLALASQVAQQAPTGADLGQLGNIAAKVGNLMPGLKADDVLDVTMAMRQRAGEDFARVGGDEFEASMAKLQAAGMDPLKAMSLGLAGVEANLPSKAINKIAESLFEQDPTAGKHGRLSATEQLQRKFYKLDANARFQALSSDKLTAEAVLGAGGALNMQMIGDTTAQQASLQRAMKDDFAAKQIGQLGGFQAGREMLREQQTAAEFDLATRATAMEEAQFQRAMSFTRAQNANASPLTKARIEATGTLTGFTGVMRGPGDAAFGRTDKTKAEQLITEEFAREGAGGRMGVLSDAQVKAFMQQEKATSAMIMELKQINHALRTKKNVDAHVE